MLFFIKPINLLQRLVTLSKGEDLQETEEESGGKGRWRRSGWAEDCFIIHGKPWEQRPVNEDGDASAELRGGYIRERPRQVLLPCMVWFRVRILAGHKRKKKKQNSPASAKGLTLLKR